VNRLLAPVTAGLAAAAIAFAAVALATDGGDERPSAASADGRGLFVSMGCGSCHHLTAAGANGQIGPDLDVELDEHTRESLTAKIREPGPASIMPGDFDARMTDAELAALVDFLLATR
jgi:mono/diheme cytochrome c family protein